MKHRLFLLAVLIPVILILGLLANAVAAQDVPSPYAGMENPFPWDDASARNLGKQIYQQSCLGCHGINGGNIASADFSSTEYIQELEESPDYNFWILSDGMLEKGMPPFKSSLSEEQRRQVLIYLHSLGPPVTPEKPPPPAKPPTGGTFTLLLTVPESAQSGQPLNMTTSLKDEDGKPIGGVPVNFLLGVDFFLTGVMEIGEAVTDESGLATFEYIPRQSGAVQVMARYMDAEAVMPVNLAEADGPFYEAKVDFRLPVVGEELFTGPASSLEPGEMGEAPKTVFRLPGSILSWLWLFAGAIMLIWFTYFRVMYQVFKMPIQREILDTNTRLVPMVFMAVIVTIGIVLVLMILTGPYTNIHLLR